jgi:pyruvate dehydrogenase E2 component (dihydrolipoamide acetyltransferase)
MSAIEVKVPDIGDFKEVEVIELLVKPGDTVAVEQSLITVESDKASMEVPSSVAGKVLELRMKIGDKVAEGSIILTLEPAGTAAAVPAAAAAASSASVAPVAAATPLAKGAVPVAVAAPVAAAAPITAAVPVVTTVAAAAPPVQASAQVEVAVPARAEGPAVDVTEHKNVTTHASPSVRKFARELGVTLTEVPGTGPKQRITQDDVRHYVKAQMSGAGRAANATNAGNAATGANTASAAGSGASLGLIAWPKVDFAKFGPVQSQPLSRIKKISGANLHRNWVMIPHVTNHEDADITELEALRLQLNVENAKSGAKLTMLAFLIKACVAALKRFPEFNSSLDGENLILKQYYHIGFAADTPTGLVVPVIRNADQKGLLELAKESAELAGKAREGKLAMGDMQGGTFSISSLGGIGGTSFTPIINAPEVAILGVCRASKKPVWDDRKDAFVPRLIMPLSLSWDHRVVDGAGAARFNVYLAQLLADFRRVLL